MASRLSRRKALWYAGCALTSAVSGIRAPVSALGQQTQRPFEWGDAYGRSDIERIAISPGGEAVAVQVTRSLGEPGLHAGVPERHIQPRGDIWLLDPTLENPLRLELDGLWAWAPCFSPRGTYLAALISRGDGKVGLVIWPVKTRSARLFLDAQVDIYSNFRVGSVVEGQPSPYGDVPKQFAWLDDDSLIFVQPGGQEPQPEREIEAAAETYATVWRRSSEGRPSLRVWDATGTLCGMGKTVVRMERSSGQVQSLFQGAIRGVSISPTRNWLAVVIADERVQLAAGVAVQPGLGYFTSADDPLVVCGVVRVDPDNHVPPRRVDELKVVGAVPPRRLPIWSCDGSSFAVPARCSYSALASSGDDLCWYVDAASLLVRKWSARSALDAELMACMSVCVGAQDCESALASRPAVGGTMSLLGVARSEGTVWKFGDSSVAVWNGRDITTWGFKGEGRVPGAFRAVYPSLESDKKLSLYCQIDDTFACIVNCADHSYQVVPIQWRGSWAFLGVDCEGTRVIAKEDSDSGTHLFDIRPKHRPRRSALIFNEHFSNVAKPEIRRIVRRTEGGAEQAGILQLPVGRASADKHPVIVWAYPNQEPTIDGWITRINSVGALWRPLQYLLTRGFAVFHAPLPIAMGVGREPLQTVAQGALSWLDVLEAQPEILPGEFGFFGHSNAGYVALSLEVMTTRYKAITAFGTFPDLGVSSFAARKGSAMLDCAASVIQAERFYYEYENQPYGLGTPFWVDQARYLRNSPLYRLGSACTPLLLLQGEFDAGSHEVEEVYSILHGLGVPVELAYYWGEGHILASPGNLRDMWERTERFFRKYLRMQS